MKILLMGEYSGVYSELRAGFRAVGHDAFIVTNGDGFKNYHSDLEIDFSIKRSNILNKVVRFILFRLGINGLYRLKCNWNKLKTYISGYDVVLLINPIVEDKLGAFANLIILKYIFKNNRSVYLSVLGDDYYVSKYYSKYHLQNGFYNATIKDYLLPNWNSKYDFCLGYKYVNNYAVKHVNSILPGTHTYADCYRWCSKLGEIMPFPLSESKVGTPFTINPNEPIVIFHGWQKGKEARKGNDVFDRVIRRVVDYYGDKKVKYQIASSVPYEEYVEMFASCHIFIDQLYAQDKGYNGLLGMAAGKVVFSGFKRDVLDRYKDYHGQEIGISASANEDTLFKQFCILIENPSRMEAISINAIDFVKKYHLTRNIIDAYVKLFNRDM